MLPNLSPTLFIGATSLRAAGVTRPDVADAERAIPLSIEPRGRDDAWSRERESAATLDGEQRR